MISFKEALALLEKENPELKYSGIAYKSGYLYYINMIDKKLNGVPIDGTFIVDGNTKKIRVFMPGMDKAPNLKTIKMM